MFPYIGSMIETLGDAWTADWHLVARCDRGRRQHATGSLDCEWHEDLDMMTLVATRGRDFPLANLSDRLRCPRCGNREVRVVYVLPGDRKLERTRRPIKYW